MSEIIDTNVSSISEVKVAASSVEAPDYQQHRTFGQLLRTDLGFLPVLLTLVLIVIFFTVASQGLFLSPENFSNLIVQSAPLGISAVGAVLVLLLGEIDLSTYSVGVLCTVIMGILTERAHWPAGPSVAVALASGLLIGLINGFFVAILRIPSFIVTLAASIAYNGLLLFLLFGQTTQIIRDPFVLSIAGTSTSYLTDFWGIFLPIAAALIYIGSLMYNYRTRRRTGLRTVSLTRLIVQSVFTCIAVIGSVVLFESYFGVPYSTAILFGIILIFWLLLTRTRWGRHVYAVGGNAEAARRAGINVVSIRLVVFALASMLGGIGAIVLTSHGGSVASEIPAQGMLNIIAAAVIGGVSLFGGRGSVWAVVLGMLIVQCLQNGLALLHQTSDVQYMIEGLVLLIAVTADALIRRAQARSGR
ncbi:MAG TPA: inner-membrane translocator [Ktedonobacteraceae bacterium]|nr:inner-membrane translocator [Ktedonobacteraceae bacterium]